MFIIMFFDIIIILFYLYIIIDSLININSILFIVHINSYNIRLVFIFIINLMIFLLKFYILIFMILIKMHQ